MVRMKSPSPGSSTLITSAPSSPSRPAQNGAEIRVPTSITRSPASGPSAMTGAWQAGHPLADDVALDLGGAGPDGRRLVVQPRPLPRAVARVVGRPLPQRGGRADHG